jgi:hypothetical protein
MIAFIEQHYKYLSLTDCYRLASVTNNAKDSGFVYSKFVEVLRALHPEAVKHRKGKAVMPMTIINQYLERFKEQNNEN